MTNKPCITLVAETNFEELLAAVKTLEELRAFVKSEEQTARLSDHDWSEFMDAVAQTLKLNDFHEGVLVLRDAEKEPYSKQRHAAFSMLDAAEHFDASRFKASSAFRDSFLSLRGEQDAEKFQAAIFNAVNNLKRESREALDELCLRTGSID